MVIGGDYNLFPRGWTRGNCRELGNGNSWIEVRHRGTRRRQLKKKKKEYLHSASIYDSIFAPRTKNSRDPANDPTEHWTGRETRLSPSVVIRGIIAGLWSVVCQSQFRAVFQLPLIADPSSTSANNETWCVARPSVAVLSLDGAAGVDQSAGNWGP